MEYLQSILLGLVQGIAEFLPISSSGHLVLGGAILDNVSGDSALNLGDAENNLALNVALHVGTLGSICVIYWRELLGTLKQPRLLTAIVVATIPVVIVGLAFKDHFEAAFGSTFAVGCALCVTAALLWFTPKFDNGETALQEINLKQALTIGLFQAIAPIPGISRSGSTIVGGLVAGLKRETAATFSFLIAVPAIGGAATLETIKLVKEGTTSSSQWPAYGVGAGVAFIVGVFALKWLLAIISKRRLHYFAYYCLAVGLLAIGTHLFAA